MVSQLGLSPGATNDQGLCAIIRDSPVSVSTDPGHDVATAAAAAELHASDHGSGIGKPVTQTTKSQARANEVSLPAEQEYQALLPVPVIRGSDETDAQQLLASDFATGTGKQATVTAHSKTGAADMLGRSTPARTEPEHLPVVVAHVATAAKGRSPGHEAPAAVASGFTTAAGKPVNVTARGQAEARKLLDNAAPEALGSNAAEPMPADGATLVASGFSTGTGKALLMSAAAQARAAQTLTDDSTVDEQLTATASEPSSAAAIAKAPSGFSTGTGKVVLMSAAAMARAQKALADDSTADKQLTAAASEPFSATAPAKVPSGFSTGTGKAVLMSAASTARAQKVLADNSTVDEQSTAAASEPSSAAAPANAPSGFSTGTGKAVLVSAAAMARAQQVLADDSTAPQQTTGVASELPSVAAPAMAPSGFSTGTGEALQFSAAAKAWAQKVLADDSTAAEQPTGVALEPPRAAAPAVAPSGFSTGTGKALQFSAAAKARAEKLFADDSTADEHPTGAASEPASAAASRPAPSGFTSGQGTAVPISAAAQAQAKSMFQDENAVPLHPAADMDNGTTPAGSNSRPVSARPVLGTPRTGPPISKPAMKRVKELSQSTGGKLFKKPRMSKIVSPFCPGAVPHRVRLH